MKAARVGQSKEGNCSFCTLRYKLLRKFKFFWSSGASRCKCSYEIIVIIPFTYELLESHTIYAISNP